MSLFDRLAAWAQQALLPLGATGLFAAAVLDSSFVPLPGGVDLWLISLCVLDPARMPFYAVIASLGSVLGCSLMYFVARKSEEVFLEPKLKDRRTPRVRQWIDQYGSLALFLAALLPPPAPFKLFVLTAGLVKHRFGKFLVVLTAGRLLRYFLEGLLAIRYGRQVWEWMIRSGPLVFSGITIVLLLWLLARVRRGRATAEGG
ncbi:MAG: VTT domain-containing protein [Acidobacteria bacterium]|nr:VTT domain-containing protein [Acidobacteriota bacterium]